MPAEMRHALDRGGTRADDGDALVGKPVQVAVGVATGIAVIPPAGVEAMALVAVDAGDARQLRPVPRPVGQNYKAFFHAVVAVSRDQPSTIVFHPAQLADFGLEAGQAI